MLAGTFTKEPVVRLVDTEAEALLAERPQPVAHTAAASAMAER